MRLLFQPRANAIAQLVVLSAVTLPVLGLGGILLWPRTAYSTRVGMVLPQPVAFSHEHHTRALGIDCRFCHTTAETSATAGMPSTGTCMHCHSEIWSDSPMLAPVRRSWNEGQPIEWERVHDLPDFVYFNHAVHVNAGVGCASCHGRVDRMPMMSKAKSLRMSWCLDCHRDPGSGLLEGRADAGGAAVEQPLLFSHPGLTDDALRGKGGLTDCVTCHR